MVRAITWPREAVNITGMGVMELLKLTPGQVGNKSSSKLELACSMFGSTNHTMGSFCIMSAPSQSHFLSAWAAQRTALKALINCP